MGGRKMDNPINLESAIRRESALSQTQRATIESAASKAVDFNNQLNNPDGLVETSRVKELGLKVTVLKKIDKITDDISR